MSPPLSTHIPGIAGTLTEVNGEAVVDTKLKAIQTVVSTLNIQNMVSDQEAFANWYPLDGFDSRGNIKGSKIVLRVEKGGANHGLLGTTDVNVSWIAVGFR